MEQDIDHLAAFENPKEQFTTEITELADTVTEAIETQRNRRVRSGSNARDYYATSDPIAPKGVFGLFTKAVRKVRDFFGLFGKRRKAVNEEVTAYDAGEGMAQVLGSLRNDEEAAESRFPLLSKTILSRIPDTIKPQADRLALVAPEALNFIFSMTPDRAGHRQLIDSVTRNPHELRFVTHFKKRYGRYYLDSVQRASRTLLPAIRDVLPADGSQVRATYDQVQSLLKAETPRARRESEEPQNDAGPHTGPKRLRDRFQALFRRNKKR
jgi:hypothetical protein